MICFSVKEPDGVRTYIYDKDEKYVIVLEPKHNNTIYYLLTAYHLRGKDAQRNKILKSINEDYGNLKAKTQSFCGLRFRFPLRNLTVEAHNFEK